MSVQSKLELLTYGTNKADHNKITVRLWCTLEEHSWNQHDHIILVLSQDKHENVRTQQL